MTPILSILTPTIPSRDIQLSELVAVIWQSAGLAVRAGLIKDQSAVEHRILGDEPGQPRLTIGAKRDRLIREARGKYVAFVDDDDMISVDYVAEILEAAKSDPDVITFHQSATVDGEEGFIEFKLGSPNEPFKPGELTRRNAWHVCAWRRDLAIQSQFPKTGKLSGYGEDWAWAEPLCRLEGLREVHLTRVIHYYRHSRETTAAPPPA